jgi:hypothetical protein
VTLALAERRLVPPPDDNVDVMPARNVWHGRPPRDEEVWQG